MKQRDIDSISTRRLVCVFPQYQCARNHYSIAHILCQTQYQSFCNHHGIFFIQHGTFFIQDIESRNQCKDCDYSSSASTSGRGTCAKTAVAVASASTSSRGAIVKSAMVTVSASTSVSLEESFPPWTTIMPKCSIGSHMRASPWGFAKRR